MATKSNDDDIGDDYTRRGYVSGGGLVPVPDPTKLTTDQLRQEVKALRELIEARMDGTATLINTLKERIDARDSEINQAVTHVRELVFSNIENVKGSIEKLADVSAERFTRIDTQFIERDKRTDQLSLADKTAVAAALQAAKEAVGAQNTSNSIAIAKSESSTVESIRQLQALFNTANAATNDKINDLKSRLDRGEGKTTGHTDSWVMIFGLGGLIIAVVAVIGLVVKFHS